MERFNNIDFFKLLTNNSFDIISVISAEGTIIFESNATERLLGYKSNERTGKNVFDFVHQDDKNFVIKKFEKAILNNEKFETFEFRILKEDGSWIWLESTGQNFLNNPQINGIIVNSRDITKRKKFEEALIESEQTISMLFEKIPLAIFNHDLDGKLLNVNDIAAQYTGYSKEELLNMSVSDIDHSSLTRNDCENIWKELNFGGQRQFLSTHYRKDGTNYPVIISATAIKYKNEPVIYGVVQDITELKKAEQFLKENVQRLKSLVNIFQKQVENKRDLLDYTLEEAIKLTNSKIGYIYFYDFDKEQFVLYSWSKNVKNECLMQDKKTVYNLSETGIWGEAVRQRKPILINDFEAENQYKKGYPKGHAHLDKFLTIPIFDNNNIVAVIGVANKKNDYNETDILHLDILMNNTWKILQKLENETLILKQNKELQKLTTDQNRFMQILSHDLRSPFNSLLGFSKLLYNNIENYDIQKIKKQVGYINEISKNIYNLLDDLLLWSKSQAGKLVFSPEFFGIKNLCREVIEGININAKQKQIEIKCLINDEITIYADIKMIKTVLRNIISNAVKFTNEKGTIKIVAENNQNNLKISILDNGIGISEEDINKLWDKSIPYTTKGTNNEAGTGLGLLLCKEFIEKHSGKIWVESSQGKGSNFIFTIPQNKTTS